MKIQGRGGAGSRSECTVGTWVVATVGREGKGQADLGRLAIVALEGLAVLRELQRDLQRDRAARLSTAPARARGGGCL